MLDLYADWCIACKEFEAITFSDPEVKKRLAQMVFLQADVTDNDMVDIELLEHYKVKLSYCFLVKSFICW